MSHHPSHRPERNSTHPGGIRVVRWRYGGQRVEVPVWITRFQEWLAARQQRKRDAGVGDDDGAASSNDDEDDAVGGGGTGTDAAAIARERDLFRKMLVADRIFSNAAKREVVAPAALRKAFGTRLSESAIVKRILLAGELVETQEERDRETAREKHEVDAAVAIARWMIASPFTGEPFDTDDVEMDAAIKASLPLVKKSVHEAAQQRNGSSDDSDRKLGGGGGDAAGSSPLSAPPQQCWVAGAWLARRVTLALLQLQTPTHAAVFAAPFVAEAVLRVESASAVAPQLTKIKGLLQMTWPGLVKLVFAAVLNNKNEAAAQSETGEAVSAHEDVALVFLIAGDFFHLQQHAPAARTATTGAAAAAAASAAQEKDADAHGPESLAANARRETNEALLGWAAAFRAEFERLFGDSIFFRAKPQAEGAPAAASAVAWLTPCADAQRSKAFFSDGVADEPPLAAAAILPAAAAPGTATATSAAPAAEKRPRGKKPQQQQAQQLASDEDEEPELDKFGRPIGGGKARSSGDGAAAATGAVADKYSTMSHQELQKAAKKLSLSSGGSKVDLIARLRAAAAATAGH